MKNLVTLYNTIKYLKPVQIFYRVKKKFVSQKKPLLTSCPPVRSVNLLIPEIDLEPSYIQRFNAENISNGKVELLHQTVAIEFTKNNKEALLPLIWFNLQYFEYAIALGSKYKESGNAKYVKAFKDAYLKFIEADMPYAAYVISLQLPNILIALELFGSSINDIREKINLELYRKYKWLIKHQELHLLGNHCFENLKAIIIGAFYFQENEICHIYCNKLKEEIREQILGDGFHFELSPMYHKIVLEDLLRINQLACSNEFPKCSWLKATIQDMANAMCSLENGFNRTPLFNDAGDNVAKPANALKKAVHNRLQLTLKDKVLLSKAGYYKLYDDKLAIIIDAGAIGPDYIPGHGQCDCLSYELAYDGIPVIVNSGTFQYQGEQRTYYRSTAAHNTFMVDKREQSECWGEHRVGRRMRDISVKAMEYQVNATCVTMFGDKCN